MKITRTEENHTIEVSYSVTDAPIMLKRYTKAHNYQPDELTVRFFNGAAVRVMLAGPRVLKSGAHSPVERLDESFGTDWDRDRIPDWITPYLVLDK